MIVEGTQYHRPDGRPEIVRGEIRDDLKSQWETLSHAGLRLEMEILPGGLTSLTLTDPDRGDYAIRVVSNSGRRPIMAVEAMVSAFDLSDLETWRAAWDETETVDETLVQGLMLRDEIETGGLTDELLDRLAEEAEEGYKVENLRPRARRGRSPLGAEAETETGAVETAETRSDDYGETDASESS